MPRRPPGARRRCGAARPGPVAHRRGQARQPVQGRAGRDRRPGRPRRGLRGRRRAARLGAHRGAPLRRHPRRPRRRARRGRRPGAAQGLHRHRLPGAGRPAPTAPTSCCSSSRRSTRRRLVAPARARAIARHDRRSSRCTTRRRPERAVDAGARVIGVNARDLKTLELDRDTFARLAPAHPRRRRQGRRVRRAGPARRRRLRERRVPTPCSSARPSSPDRRPARPRSPTLVAAGAYRDRTSGPDLRW